MIKVEAINGAPSITPTEFIGSHFDGEYFYFFESEEDKDTFYASLPKVWSKEAHIAEINALHEAEFDRRWRSADYVGRWEVVDVARDASNEYHEEAKALMSYWWNGWAAIKAYSETVAENNFIEPLDFVNAL